MTGKKQRNKTINTKKPTFFNLALTLLNYELFATMCINLWKTVCSEKNIYFLHACFFKCWKRLLIKRLLVKNKKNYFRLCIDYESNKYMVTILVFKKFRRAHHNGCNLKLAISYSILHSTLISTPAETLTGLKSTCPTVLYISFCSIIITQLLYASLKSEL